MGGFPKRKQYRLRDYDYSRNGAYFITICTKDKKHILSSITENGVELTNIGNIVEKAINEIPLHYKDIFIDKYVVMPNHVHLLICITHRDEIGNNENGRPMVVPTVSRVIQQMKGYVTKQAGIPVWQKKSYDHVIRNDADYAVRYQYIENNPVNWILNKDEYC